MLNHILKETTSHPGPIEGFLAYHMSLRFRQQRAALHGASSCYRQGVVSRLLCRKNGRILRGEEELPLWPFAQVRFAQTTV